MSTLIVGCGYLGRRVAARLLAQGERVFATTRSPARGGEFAAMGVEPVVADVLDTGTLSDLPAADRVVYCVGFDRSRGMPLRTVYVDGLRNVLSALPSKTDRVVYASATSVYGQSDGRWVTEESPAEPVHESGRVCLDAETMALDRARLQGVALSIVRYSGLYGPGRVVRRSALEAGEPIAGDPDKFLNLIHVDDASSAAVAALDRGEAGRVYLASDDRPLTRREYYTLAASLLNAPPPTFTGGATAGREDSNKRVSNRRIKEELGLKLAFPDVVQGLPACLSD